MRKALLSAVLVVSVFLFCSAGIAAELKFGYVEIQRAVSESAAGKQAMERFAASVNETQQDLLKEKEEVEKLGEIIQKQSMMLTDAVRREKEKEFLRRQRDYERRVKDSKTELQIKEAELTNEILEDLLPIINTFGKENGFTIIFEKSQQILLYADGSLDLTDKIVALFDAQFKK